MEKLLKKLTIAALLLCSLSYISAAVPAGYYDSAKGLNQRNLLVALRKIVGPHTTVSYDGLWSMYKKTDVTSTGKIWDMYSTAEFTPGTKQCGSYSVIGDCYNREHSFPKSWFSDASPMVSDGYHIYPTDGKVNNQRSNYPYGECAKGTYLSASSKGKPLGKLGASTFSGYTGTVFEPDDQYKGDFARSYFYMAAAYQDRISGWNSPMLAGNDYPCFSAWTINLLLKWNREDPVSQKEIDRNEGVSSYQKNRNPFIDYPELAEYIWGTQKTGSWTPGGAVTPTLVEPTAGSSYDAGVTAVGSQRTIEVPVKGSGLTEDLTARVTGSYFSTAATTITKDATASGTTIVITYAPTAVGTHSATLEIWSGEVNTTVALTGTATDGIPAEEATDITQDGFTAHWMDVDGTGNYDFSLFESDGTTLVGGYPKAVATSALSYKVTGLNYSTTYNYQLSSGTRKSNMVKVTTAAPTRILSLVAPAEGYNLTAEPGAASNILQVGVYTEYVTENITAEVTGNFVLSKDKTTWSKTVEINPDGENFYVKIEDTSKEGVFDGGITLSTPTLDGEDATLSGVVSAPRSFFEDFESMVTTSYNGGQGIQGTACKWDIVDGGVFGRTGDHFNGKQCLCLGKTATSSLTMAEDKTKGASTLIFFAAPYTGDGDATLKVSYSTNSGESWTLLGTATVTLTALQEFRFPINAPGNIRIKIEQTEGKRVSIDDISLSDFSTGGIGDMKAPGSWDAYAAQGGIAIESDGSHAVEIYSMAAVKLYGKKVASHKTIVPMAPGVYVVVSGNDSRKVIVK